MRLFREPTITDLMKRWQRTPNNKTAVRIRSIMHQSPNLELVVKAFADNDLESNIALSILGGSRTTERMPPQFVEALKAIGSSAKNEFNRMIATQLYENQIRLRTTK